MPDLNERTARLEARLEALHKLMDTQFELANRALILKEHALREKIEDSTSNNRAWIAVAAIIVGIVEWMLSHKF